MAATCAWTVADSSGGRAAVYRAIIISDGTTNVNIMLTSANAATAATARA